MWDFVLDFVFKKLKPLFFLIILYYIGNANIKML